MVSRGLLVLIYRFDCGAIVDCGFSVCIGCDLFVVLFCHSVSLIILGSSLNAKC